MTTQLLSSPSISVKNNKPITTSQDVAVFFEKRHERVLDRIKKLDCSPTFTQHNFVFSEYVDCTGRKLPLYEMTKDGFIFLVMGFTGKKAAQFKEAYINAFNEMEVQLRNIQSGSKSTTQQRTPLRDAVNLLVGQKGLMYPQAYNIIHQRFNVAHLDELTDEQIPLAIEYVHKLALEGEYIPMKKESSVELTDNELCSFAWLFAASVQMINAIDAVEPLLRVADHKRKGEFFSIVNEHPRVLNKARQILMRETESKEVDMFGRDRWSHPLSLIRKDCLPLLGEMAV